MAKPAGIPHPRYLAEQRRLVAERRHFTVHPHEYPTSASPAAKRFFRNWQKGAPDPFWDAAFTLLTPAIAHATAAELLGQVGAHHPRDRARTKNAREEQWVADYLERAKGHWRVRTELADARRDSNFWWWLVRSNGSLLLEIPLEALDAAALLSGCWNPHERKTPLTRIELLAVKRSAKGRRVCLLPAMDLEGLLLGLAAGKKEIRELHDLALSRATTQDNALPDDGALAPVDSLTMVYPLVELQGAENAEQWIAETLERGARRVSDAKATDRALCTAELVAFFEGRGTPGIVFDADAQAQMQKWSRKYGALSLETIAKARETVERIARDMTFDKKWVKPDEIEPWTAMMSDLSRRLRAAESARRARLGAANARPIVIPEDAVERVAPGKMREMPFYAVHEDAGALLEAIHESSGTLFCSEGLEMREIASEWELRERLAQDVEHTPMGVPQAHFYIWWRDAGGTPSLVAHYWDDEERDAETGEERPVERAWYGPGWGMAEVLLRGGVRDERSARIAVSVISYPTGNDLTSPRHKLRGPWHDIDWKAVKRSVSKLRRALHESTDGDGKRPALPRAAALVKRGAALADRYGVARD